MLHGWHFCKERTLAGSLPVLAGSLPVLAGSLPVLAGSLPALSALRLTGQRSRSRVPSLWAALPALVCAAPLAG